MTGADIQKLVKNVFGERGKGDPPPFREFSDEGGKQLRALLQDLAKLGHTKSDPKVRALVPVKTDKKGLVSVIQYALDLFTTKQINPTLVKMALGIYLTHSSEAQSLGVAVPELAEHSDFARDPSDPPFTNPITADTMTGIEKLSYFREDYDFNDHHYHWHFVYPYAGVPGNDDKQHRVIDRQGELFLYMHSQMIARYNAELLSWGLDLTHGWGYDDVLEFGYTPVPGNRKAFGARPPFRGWFETHNPNLPDDKAPASKQELIKWRDNIFTAIKEGFFHTTLEGGKAGTLVFDKDNAMNWVGLVVESAGHDLQEVKPGSGEYINRDLYGALHNHGHDKFAEIGYHEYIYDKNPMGVMTSNTTAPRDPCFWLWHTHIDSFHLAIVKKYNHDISTSPPEVKIVDFNIVSREEFRSTLQTGSISGLATYLGPPQSERKEHSAKISHEKYQWEITVESTRYMPPSKVLPPQTFTVRIFIAPNVLIHDQRSWIEMDKFTHTLTGFQDTVIRLDTQSSVARKTPKLADGELSSRCLCGWPQNMMLPNGTPEGIDYTGFAILTDDALASDDGTQSTSFCGAKDGKYPDPRGMGYPFDKTWTQRVNSTTTVPEIVKGLPHVKLCQFRIYRHTELYQQPKVAKLPIPDADITWDKKIKAFFTKTDRDCMLINNGRFDLGKKEDVKEYADRIYIQVNEGGMPIGGPQWDSVKVATFQRWIGLGFP